MRPEVPRLLAEGMEPVLYLPGLTSVQQLGIEEVTRVVLLPGVAGPVGLEAAVLRAWPLGARGARLAELEPKVALRQPLAAGSMIRREYSRPYIYAPLKPSRRVCPRSPITAQLQLDRGSYAVAVEIFHRGREAAERGIVTIQAADGSLIRRADQPLGRIVRSSLRTEFCLPERGAVSLTITATGPALVHAWEVTRR
jgi:hypothetical protein